MDSSTITNYGNLILAALSFGYAIWTKYSARQQAAAATEKARQALVKATAAGDHATATSIVARGTRDTVEDLKRDVASAKDGTDEAYARYVLTDALLKAVPQRMEAQNRALVYLAGRIGALEELADGETDQVRANGRHRYPITTAIDLESQQEEA